jgi:hypothetical protein
MLVNILSQTLPIIFAREVWATMKDIASRKVTSSHGLKLEFLKLGNK